MDHEADDEFTEFVAAVSRRLLHAADLLVGDRAGAEDLVQHALAAAYSRWPAIRQGNPEAYVRRTMLNRHLDWWRRVLPHESSWPAKEVTRAPGCTQVDHAEGLARRDQVLRALDALTRRERAVVVLRFWLDLPETQITAELGIAPGTVKSTCARALARLRTNPHLVPEPPDDDAPGSPTSVKAAGATGSVILRGQR